jgi:hypothetical protein
MYLQIPMADVSGSHHSVRFCRPFGVANPNPSFALVVNELVEVVNVMEVGKHYVIRKRLKEFRQNVIMNRGSVGLCETSEQRALQVLKPQRRFGKKPPLE